MRVRTPVADRYHPQDNRLTKGLGQIAEQLVKGAGSDTGMRGQSVVGACNHDGRAMTHEEPGQATALG